MVCKQPSEELTSWGPAQFPGPPAESGPEMLRLLLWPPVLAAGPKVTHGRVPAGSTGRELTQLLHLLRARCCAEPSPPALACSPATCTPWDDGIPASRVYPCLPVARASSGLVWELLGPADTPCQAPTPQSHSGHVIKYFLAWWGDPQLNPGWVQKLAEA